MSELPEVDEISSVWSQQVASQLKSAYPLVSCAHSGQPVECIEGKRRISIVLHRINCYGRIVPMTVDEAMEFHSLLTEDEPSTPSLLTPPTTDASGVVSMDFVLDIREILQILIADKSSNHLSSLQVHCLVNRGAQMAEKVKHFCLKTVTDSPYFYGDYLKFPSMETQRLLQKMSFLDQTLRDKIPAVQAHSRSVTDANHLSLAIQTLIENYSREAKSLPRNAVVYDMDALAGAVARVQATFPAHSCHCFAAKAAPLPYLLHFFIQSGCGVEAASIMEVRQALRLHCDPKKVVFDSPCKTYEEVREALLSGVTVNANTFNEVEKMKRALRELQHEGIHSSSQLGLRINPLVGSGAIAELSTANATSKFGIPLTETNRAKILECFKDNAEFNGLMVHVGSTGMALDTMTEGIAIIHQLANEIDAFVEDKDKDSRPRIQYVDIGGGLNANTDADELAVSFEDYVKAIDQRCPEVLQNQQRTIITEFGKSLVLKTAGIISQVEDKLVPEEESLPVTSIIHAGADLFLRPSYVPEMQNHRLRVLSSQGELIPSPTSANKPRLVNIAGPLCHSADYLAKGLSNTPEPQVGDFILVLDCGGNTLSMFSKHCSRKHPAVFAFRRHYASHEIVLARVKEEESEKSALNFWI